MAAPEQQTQQLLLTPEIPVSEALAPLHVIRTETVLSKLPMHLLAKRGNFEIGILRRRGTGQVDLQWEVSYSSKYGAPRQLAYKLDTLVVNRRIDEHQRPVPKTLRLGSLNQICAELDMLPSGRNLANLKRAILQNAGSLITAKMGYRTVEGVEKRLEAVFTRYSVVFTGENLPNGSQADGVYLIFNEPYWEVLNHAPVRPLNYDYLKSLPPAPQRFYEIVSYRMFVALKYGHSHARLSYSDFCTYSAQQRYFDYDQFKKQMYKVHRPHILSHYISDVSYEASVDADGQLDWVMCYQPGKKAHSEYAAFERRPAGIGNAVDDGFEFLQPDLNKRSLEARASSPVIDELTRRGIGESRAKKLLGSLAEEQRVLDQLEWGDFLIRQSAPHKFHNPPGLYIYLLRENITPPENFVTSRKRLAKARAASENELALQEQLALELAYDAYRQEVVDRELASIRNTPEFQATVAAKRQELLKQYRSLSVIGEEELRKIAYEASRAEIANRLTYISFNEFCSRRPKSSHALGHKGPERS